MKLQDIIKRSISIMWLVVGVLSIPASFEMTIQFLFVAGSPFLAASTAISSPLMIMTAFFLWTRSKFLVAISLLPLLNPGSLFIIVGYITIATLLIN